MSWITSVVLLLGLSRTWAGLLMPGGGHSGYGDDDEFEPVYRLYSENDWDSHDDYLSQERSARDGDKDDSQFRSWKLDQWHHAKIQKVKVEIYDDGKEVAEFEFDGDMQNMTSFFDFKNLRRSTYTDIPVGTGGRPFDGDNFSFDGDDDARHWTVSGRHTGDCRNDDGWFQVLDKPKPGRDRCVCGYENVNKYPSIMYAKGGRKTRWSDKHNVGHGDMMQVSVSHRPYPKPVMQPQPRPQPRPQPPPRQPRPQPPPMQPQYPPEPQYQPRQTMYQFETKK